MAVQMLFYALALAGRKREGLMNVPYQFLSLHVAAVCGLLKYLQGDHYATWTPRNQ
jgi:hypothetical protein